MEKYPNKILLISGKRKSGKDFIAEELLTRLGKEEAVIIRISSPIKNHWAKINNLSFEDLTGSSEYKENYRIAMIKWGEEIRANDHGYFCRAAIDMYDGYKKPIWIVSDTRRKTDLKWFSDNFVEKVKTLRVVASDEVRTARGWVFTNGVDDVESECDLDDVTDWNWVIENGDDNTIFEETFKLVYEWLKS